MVRLFYRKKVRQPSSVTFSSDIKVAWAGFTIVNSESVVSLLWTENPYENTIVFFTDKKGACSEWSLSSSSSLALVALQLVDFEVSQDSFWLSDAFV